MKKLFFFVSVALLALAANATEPTTAPAAPTWPAAQVKSLYCDKYEAASALEFGYWGGNPAPSYTDVQISEGNNIKKAVMGAWNYVGFNLTNPFNVLTMEKVHVDLYSEAALKTYLYFSDKGKIEINIPANEWKSFDIDLADFTGLEEVSSGKFADGENGTIWFDNLYFYRTTALADSEAPTAVSASLSAASFFSVDIKAKATDNSGAVTFTVYNGEDVVATGGAASAAETTITVSNLAANTSYNFSVVASDDAGNKAAAVAVVAKTLELPAAAPTPSAAAANVKALYSDAYTPAVAVTDYVQSWWNPALLTAAKLGDDNVLLYYNPTEGGSHGWQLAADLNATGFVKFHVHIYPLAAGTITFKFVAATEFEKTTATLKANEWNDVVIDLTDSDISAVKQIGWVNYAALQTFFVDNVYFYKESSTALDNLDANRNVVKRIVDGQLLIEKNGILYNAMGTPIK